MSLRVGAHITLAQLAERKANYSMELSAQLQEPEPFTCSKSSPSIQYIYLLLWIE
jgi:hypothetical protein